MNILDAINNAPAGSMVTISSPCTGSGCRTAESSFAVEDLVKAISAPGVALSEDYIRDVDQTITARVTTTQGDDYEFEVPAIPEGTASVPSVFCTTEGDPRFKQDGRFSSNTLFDGNGKILG